MKYSTNVHLSELSNDRYQLLYTNQCYGTFFGVFARFKINSGKIKSVKFQLVNFKGILNIGLNHVEYLGQEEEKIDNNFEATGNTLVSPIHIKCLAFDFKIQALSGKEQFPLIEEEEMLIDKDLMSIKDHYISIRRKIVPLEGEGKSPQPLNSEVNNVFDSEFFYRDGDRPPYSYKDDHMKFRQGRPDDGNPKGTGKICPRGFSKIIF